MSSALPSRPLALSLALCASLGFAPSAQADFIYGRLVPAPGVEAEGASTYVDVSADGRTVVFASTAQNWFDNTYNGTIAVAIDLDTGLMDAASLGASGLFRGESPVVSGDGRYVAFLTHSHPLGPNWQVLRKDRQTGALELASANAAGQPPATGTQDNTVSISADGRYVAFQSGDDLTGAGQGFAPQGSSGIIYVKDMQTGQVEIASATSGGATAGDCALYRHALSATGRYLVMTCSSAAVPGATSGQAYVRDLQANTTELVSRSTTAPSGASAFANRPAISPSGRFVSFQTRGYGGLGYANGVDSAGNSGVYLRDRQSPGATIPIPRPVGIPASDYDSCSVSSVSDIGSVLLSCNYAWTGAGSYPQVFLFVPGAGAPEMLSVAGSQPGNSASGYTTAVNASGLSMAWESNASNIDPDDNNGASDIFVLVEESILTDAIFIDGFESAPARPATAPARAHIAPIGVSSAD